MEDTITRYVAALAPQPGKAELLTLLKALGDRLSSQAVTGAGLEIAAGSSPLAQIGSTVTFRAVVDGILVTKAAGTDMPALTGLVITANSFNVACFFIDSAGVVTAAFGTEGTTLAKVKFPKFPEKKALVGFLIITHSSTFTGGTTALDTATTQYVSPVGAFDPTVLL